MPIRWRVLVAVVAALGVLVAYTSRDRGGSSAAVGGDALSFERAHRGLCDALEVGEAGELGEAQGLFLSRSHMTLHALAAELSNVDRAAAARLLEAKAEVEQSLPTGAADAPADLRRLAEATSQGIAALDLENPPSCQSSPPEKERP